MATQRQSLNIYAITLVTYQRHRHFQKTVNAELFLATLFHYQHQGKYQLHGFVVMPDHVHVLITPSIDQPTSRAVQLLKGGYSHANKQAQNIWQSGHHEHRVRTTMTTRPNSPT